MALQLSSFETVINDLKLGRMVILIDDEERENEGDLVVLSQFVATEHIAFMLNHGKGLICTVLSVDRALELDLPMQGSLNLSSFNTPFAVSVDHNSVIPNGINAKSRAKTITFLANVLEDKIDSNLSRSSNELICPGHVFPLIAHPRGVFGRRGQTEGSYDLARIAGVTPSAVICEILAHDGTMLRGAELQNFANLHRLNVTSVEEIKNYRLNHDPIFQRSDPKIREIKGHNFDAIVFEDEIDGKEHLFLTYNSHKFESERPLIRIHSECLTGDIFGSQRCDCGWQLEESLNKVIDHGHGGVLYLRQEGRGIGLGNKIKAYGLQDRGDDTVDANLKLGFSADDRNFLIAAKILKSFKISSLELLTNNPDKVLGLKAAGFKDIVVKPLISDPNEFNQSYLATKREKLGHFI